MKTTQLIACRVRDANFLNSISFILYPSQVNLRSSSQTYTQVQTNSSYALIRTRHLCTPTAAPRVLIQAFHLGNTRVTTTSQIPYPDWSEPLSRCRPQRQSVLSDNFEEIVAGWRTVNHANLLNTQKPQSSLYGFFRCLNVYPRHPKAFTNPLPV